MSAVNLANLSRPTWQAELANAIWDPAELLARLDLSRDLLPGAVAAAHDFRMRVPRGFVARMRPGDSNDPLLRQVLPLDAELQEMPGYSDDPVSDLDAMIEPGMLHKYHGRVLLTVTGACGVHCRYCFRRHFPYTRANPMNGNRERVLHAIASDPTIREVILSGGDPLTLDNLRFTDLARELAMIPHLRRMRIHTRMPILIPARVDEGLVASLEPGPLQNVMVVHCNHANEIDPEVRAAMRRLSAAGVTLFNQAVLLQGVNDSVQAQCDLSEALFSCSVIPYYLHQLDPVRGAAHFAVDTATAQRLLEGMRGRLPGYLVPKLVTEITGMPSKVPLPVK